MLSRFRNRGAGPGPITDDGCAVDLYLQLPYRGEVELIEDEIPAGASILEMGCGVGRITKQLLARGHRVTAVDNSPDMLVHVPSGARTICSDIETLDQSESYDVALLASCLINVPVSAVRLEQLNACRRHLGAGGRLILERYDPTWLSNVRAGHLGATGNIEMWLDEISRSGTTVEMCLRYQCGANQWRHYFSASILEDQEIDLCLAQAGFAPVRWINRSWGLADAA